PIGCSVGRCGSFGRGFALDVGAHDRALVVALDFDGPVQRCGRRLAPDEPADLRRGLECDVLAVTQPDAELAVIHCLPTEGRFRDAGAATKRLDFPKQRIRRALTHRCSPPNEWLLCCTLRAAATIRSSRNHCKHFCPLYSPIEAVGSIPPAPRVSPGIDVERRSRDRVRTGMCAHEPQGRSSGVSRERLSTAVPGETTSQRNPCAGKSKESRAAL